MLAGSIPLPQGGRCDAAGASRVPLRQAARYAVSKSAGRVRRRRSMDSSRVMGREIPAGAGSGARRRRDQPPRAVGVWMMIGILAAIAAIMFLLGRSVILAYERAQIAAAADAGSLYIEGILAPHAYELLRDPAPDGDLSVRIGNLVAELSATRYFAAINIWNKSGDLLFASRPYERIEAHDPDDLERALRGEVVVTLATREETEGHSPVLPPYLEVYAPILEPGAGDVVAVGEIYIDAAPLIADRQRTEAAIWLSIMLAAFALAFLTGVVAHQRRRLVERYAELAKTTAENLALLQKADAARADTVRVNEALLHDIGAELHDGPLQTLTLAALAKASQDGSKAALQSSVALSEAAAQLRRIAAGLILPEIAGLSAGEAVRLAVARHEWMTGVRPALAEGPLPEKVPDAIRTGLYRVVQEGLANAYRHAGVARAVVRIRSLNDHIEVEVENDPPARDVLPQAPHDDAARPRLGLDGLRHRIGALGGTIELAAKPDGGAILRAELPLATETGGAGAS
ncbi:MAG: hypothetical protein F9K34_09185 [Albidovulum sp.]|uniref:sensor histidine kinase n=1 Tax=Albidovulum sp. TaxID=1872424 RepID=UPI001321B1C7|nr:ATP-binding protein [Defluviimonas sp.]KAB2884297.1 MAG: hypothetical protein F9K34_09185 [Defluviimonas sp.]